LEHRAVEAHDAIAPFEHDRPQLAPRVLRVVLTEFLELCTAERLCVCEEGLALFEASAEARRGLRDAHVGWPGAGLQLGNLAVTQGVHNEELHRRVLAFLQRAKSEIRLVAGGVKVHVDLGEDVVLVAEHDLRTDDLADAIVRSVQELE
jgi:hypothetical protein